MKVSFRDGSIPQDLKDIPHFVVWQAKRNHETGKLRKVPIHPGSKRNLRWSDSRNYMTFREALGHLDRPGIDGLQFVLTHDDPFTVIDLDNCRDPITGVIDPEALALIKWADSYTEISPSGRGVHIWVKARKPGKASKNECLEMYDSKRLITLTGDHLEGTPPAIEGRQAEINAIYATHFPEKEKKPVIISYDTKNSPTLTLSDKGLLDRAHRAKNGEKFHKLYDKGDWEGLGYASQSEADQALCAMLAFWTQDREQIDRLFRASGLSRDKWEREDYREGTINKALALHPLPYRRNHPTDLIRLGPDGFTLLLDLTGEPEARQETIRRKAEEKLKPLFTKLWRKLRLRSKHLEVNYDVLNGLMQEEWDKFRPQYLEIMAGIIKKFKLPPDRVPFPNSPPVFVALRGINAGTEGLEWPSDERGKPLNEHVKDNGMGLIRLTLEEAPGANLPAQLHKVVKQLSPETADILLIILAYITKQHDPRTPVLITCKEIAQWLGVKSRDGSQGKLIAAIERQVKILAGLGLEMIWIDEKGEVVNFGTPDFPDRLIHLVEVHYERDGKTVEAFSIRAGQALNHFLNPNGKRWVGYLNPALFRLNSIKDRLAKKVGIYLTMICCMNNGRGNVTPQTILKYCEERIIRGRPRRTVDRLNNAIATLIEVGVLEKAEVPEFRKTCFQEWLKTPMTVKLSSRTWQDRRCFPEP